MGVTPLRSGGVVIPTPRHPLDPKPLRRKQHRRLPVDVRDTAAGARGRGDPALGRSERAELGEPRCARGVHRQEGLDREVRRRDVERGSESGDDREQLGLAEGVCSLSETTGSVAAPAGGSPGR